MLLWANLSTLSSCGRLHFPQTSTAISPTPPALLQGDLDSPIIRRDQILLHNPPSGLASLSSSLTNSMQQKCCSRLLRLGQKEACSFPLRLLGHSPLEPSSHTIQSPNHIEREHMGAPVNSSQLPAPTSAMAAPHLGHPTTRSLWMTAAPNPV